MKKLLDFIAWCNVNSGFFSLLLSVVAIIVSIVAIKAQNKGAVFEKRVSIYCEVSRIYSIVKGIVEKNSNGMAKRYKSIVVSLLFDYRSEEDVIFEQIGKLELENADSQPENQKKINELIEKYADLYVRKYMHSDIVEKTAIFYNTGITKNVKELFDAYDSLLLGLIIMNREDFDGWAKKASEIIDSFDRAGTLRKMKKQLPL